MRIRVMLERDPETGEWAVYCPQLPGCASCGSTEKEALANIKEAIALYLEPDEEETRPGAKVVEVAL